MFIFLCNFSPRSVNAQKKDAYYSSLIRSFQKYNSASFPEDIALYGFVYYFHRIRTQLDADNLSKPIWDALRSIAYPDDKQIIYRSSGIFNLDINEIDLLDITNIPDNVLDDFLKMIDEESHILYIELGKFDYGLFQFGYER